jgi:hypothetical protein
MLDPSRLHPCHSLGWTPACRIEFGLHAGKSGWKSLVETSRVLHGARGLGQSKEKPERAAWLRVKGI